MGKIVVKTKIWNFGDELKARDNLIGWEKIRAVEVDVLVDTGAAMLALPLGIVEELGLVLGKSVKVTYANGKVEEKEVAYGVKLELLGREAETYALVEPEGQQVLIGQIVLEGLDLYPNPKKGTLEPRPGSPDMPMMESY